MSDQTNNTSSDPVLRKLDEYGSLVLGAVGKARERVEKALGR